MDGVVADRGVMVVTLAQQYDAFSEAATQNLEATLRELAEVADPPRVLLDMSQTNCIGSTFLAAVFAAERRLKKRKGRLALCQVTPFCAEVLEIVKAERVLNICPNRDDAIRKLLEQVPAPNASN